MKYEDPKIDFENIERMYEESSYPKTRFSGSCPRVEPDRRGFRPSSMTYDEELLTTQVFQEKSESSAASSRDTYTGLPLGDIPLYLQTTLEDSERIRDDIGHEVWRCANTDCRKELRGKKNVDYFRSYNAWYCQDCMQRLHVKRCAKEECSKELYGTKNVDYFKDHEGLLCKACYDAKYNEYCANPRCQVKLSGGRANGWFWYNKQKFCPRCINSKCT